MFSGVTRVFSQSSNRIEQLAPELEKIISPSESIQELAEGFGGPLGPAEGPGGLTSETSPHVPLDGRVSARSRFLAQGIVDGRSVFFQCHYDSRIMCPTYSSHTTIGGRNP
jgi:hypothetical protein